MNSRKLHHAIALTLLLGASPLAFGQISVSVNVAPPELPVYDQPPIPGDGYLWTPGYWAWSDDDQGYYWVPGTWVEAPQPGYLWTPGYWGFSNGVYLWNAGYWGPHVGFYGGVNYGYGYGGRGYEGGYWQGGHMFYNRSVVNVGSTHITNVYNKTVINNVTVNRVSFNGGNGGVRAAPTAAEEQAGRDRHVAETSVQRQHIDAARQDTALRASENHGRPAVAATAQPGHFSGNVSAARGGGAMTGPAHGATPNSGPRNEPRAGGESRVPENRDTGQTMRRNLDRDQGPAGRPVQPQEHNTPRPQQEARPQPEMHAAPTPHPVQQPRPAETPREAPRETPRPPAPVEHPQPQVHTQAPPRPNVPEPRPQAHPQEAPHPQERAPEHH